MKIITVQSHQQSKSLPRTGSDLAIRAIEADLKPLQNIGLLSAVCMEEGNQSVDLAISGRHGNAEEEYAIKRRR